MTTSQCKDTTGRVKSEGHCLAVAICFCEHMDQFMGRRIRVLNPSLTTRNLIAHSPTKSHAAFPLRPKRSQQEWRQTKGATTREKVREHKRGQKAVCDVEGFIRCGESILKCKEGICLT